MLGRPKREIKTRAGSRWSYSPSHVRATGQAHGNHHPTTKTPAKSAVSPGSSSTDSSPSTASKSPDTKRVKFSPSQESSQESTLGIYLSQDPNAMHANSNVVQQQRFHITRTPHEKKATVYRSKTLIVLWP